MSEDRLKTLLTEALGDAPEVSAPSPRFTGEGTQVALSELPASFVEPLKVVFAQLERVTQGPGYEAFVDASTLGALEALRTAGVELAQSDLSADAKRAVKEAVGARFRATAVRVRYWGRARITQDYSQQVRFLAGDQRRLWRQLFNGLDDTGQSTDRYTGALAAETVLLHWDRSSSDADPKGLEVEVRGSLSGRVASGAECAQFTRALQALIDAAEAQGAKGIVLDAADEPGLQRVALIAEGVSQAGERADTTASGLVAQAFGMQDAAAAEGARLVGEQAAEGSLVMWVRWPRVP